MNLQNKQMKEVVVEAWTSITKQEANSCDASLKLTDLITNVDVLE